MNAPALRESRVMGKNAVLVMLGLSGLVGLLSVLGIDVSGVVADLGDGFYRLAWGATLVVAALLVFGSLLLHDDADEARVECCGLLLHVAAAIAYGWAIVTQTQAVNETFFVGSYIAAAIINCLGRVVLLLRRVWWVRRQVRP